MPLSAEARSRGRRSVAARDAGPGYDVAMSASPPLRQPCPPGACVCERERLEAPGADRRILLLTRQEEQRLAARHGSPAQLEDLEHLLRRMEEQLGIRLPGSPRPSARCATCAASMRFEEQPGLCRKTRQAIPAAIRRGWRSARKSLRPAQRPRPAARRLKALNDRKRGCRSRPGRASGVSADNAHGVIALQAAADAGEPGSA